MGKVPQNLTLPSFPAGPLRSSKCSLELEFRAHGQAHLFLKTTSVCLLSSTLTSHWNVKLPLLLEVTTQMSPLLGSLPPCLRENAMERWIYHHPVLVVFFTILVVPSPYPRPTELRASQSQKLSLPFLYPQYFSRPLFHNRNQERIVEWMTSR